MRIALAGEMICPHDRGPGMRRWLKRQARRAMRRNGRTLLGDSPTKHRYRGWSL